MNPFDTAWHLLKQGDPQERRDPAWPPMPPYDTPPFESRYYGNPWEENPYPKEPPPPLPNDPPHESPFDRNPNPHQPATITVDCPHCKGTGKTEIHTGAARGWSYDIDGPR